MEIDLGWFTMPPAPAGATASTPTAAATATCTKSEPRPVFETRELQRQHRCHRDLLGWLRDDHLRHALLRAIDSQKGGVLPFPSLDTTPRCGHTDSDARPREGPRVDHRTVLLVTDRALVRHILEDKTGRYSNRRYGELGGGNFMLALDPATTAPAAHQGQREWLANAFRGFSQHNLQALSRRSCDAAAILGLAADGFDLAAFAGQTAVRFLQDLMGYTFSDHALLSASLDAAYDALVYQVIGRHVAIDPLVVVEGQRNAGALLRRTAALLDAYAREDLRDRYGEQDPDVKLALKGQEDLQAVLGCPTLLKALSVPEIPLNGEQRAILAVGTAIGTVGNVKAAICIAVQALLNDPMLFKRARELAREERGLDVTAKYAEWQKLIAPALRRQPPIPFVPRVVMPAALPAAGGPSAALGALVKRLRPLDCPEAGVELLLSLADTRDQLDDDDDDPLIWGGYDTGVHWCVGRALAWPLIVESVRYVMGLPKLAERLDPENARPFGLTKRWGFACERYPLTHQRDERRAQSCLNVAMRIKAPVHDNAAKVRQVIVGGAPRIEQALRESRHVHFAWFELTEGDTVLVLHTVYDGPFAPYIDHFARTVGDLFDKLFEYLEDAPPAPVKKFPNEFIAHIQRYNRAPVAGYVFSAYPRTETHRIVRAAGKGAL